MMSVSMPVTLEYKLMISQEAKLLRQNFMFRPMDADKQLSEFAARLHEVCNDMGLKEWGRQTELAEKFKPAISQKAAGLWLNGKGWPNKHRMNELCRMGGVRLDWLQYGQLPKHEGVVDVKGILLPQFLDSLPAADASAAVEYWEMKLHKNVERLNPHETSRYQAMFNAFKASIQKRMR
ncbi:MAG: hypothetical protein ACRCV9_17630 [Burkholderiaceae bacterium]